MPFAFAMELRYSKDEILTIYLNRAYLGAGARGFEGAARLRFRAILMTAFSFILGVIPLVIASGAGAQSRVSLGTAVFGGMLLATIGGLVVTPFLYFIVQSFSDKIGGKKPPADPQPAATGAES